MRKNRAKGLTDREEEVASLVSEGYNNKEIGKVLGISHITVKNHITAINQKLRTKRRVQIATYMIRQEGQE